MELITIKELITKNDIEDEKIKLRNSLNDSLNYLKDFISKITDKNNIEYFNSLQNKIINYTIKNKNDADNGSELKSILKMEEKKYLNSLSSSKTILNQVRRILLLFEIEISNKFKDLTDEILQKQVYWYEKQQQLILENKNLTNNVGIIDQLISKNELKIRGLKQKKEYDIKIIDIDKVPNKFIKKELDTDYVLNWIKNQKIENPKINGLEINYKTKFHY
ncbi:hypothetical protein [Spiroplasma endosymbiont of Polydrusus cervinus]|uniref:hypothetical protein n=1 Tax=Spiroplasma endosymbiont of Polydrusus cervinus TaxID=3066287 RepID=UPI0030CDC8C4